MPMHSMESLSLKVKLGNCPPEPEGREVEFFPTEEVLHGKFEVHRQLDHGCLKTGG